MRKSQHFLTRIAILSFLIIISGYLYAQDKQGNIVQYFGKEKVEEINEGEVLHLFKEGLVLKKNGDRFSSNSVLSDPLFARILSDGSSGISEGIEEASENGLKWEKIEVGDKNDFDDRSLRSGYLYLEYNSKSAQTVLFEASGHTMVMINGMPHEGDHYDFGWNLIPLQLKKGKNEFIMSGGRFPKMRARLLKANKSVGFTKRDLTLPDMLVEENESLLGAIRVMNTNKNWFKGGSIVCNINGSELKSPIPAVSPLNVRKIPFSIPVPKDLQSEGKVQAVVSLKDKSGRVLDTDTIQLAVKSKYKHHKNTFISDVDGSVQYYSVAPSLDQDTENQAMFLSVHGASVEAVNQANAYQQKDWGHLVAPTNRRPFGFAWEDWGRLDALEVLSHSEKLLKTDPQHTYLTGHSMGGHGTWYLGATYPDRFAAIAPCAGYPDLLEYRQSFVRRMRDRPEEDFVRFGTTKAEFLKRAAGPTFDNNNEVLLDSMIRRAGNPSRTLKLKRNYLHHGVYVLHGEKDTVVPTFLARDMRERLGKYHADFAYYEYPNGTHWYGNHSVDWKPIFDFFQDRSIKESQDIEKIEFHTASPGVSATSHFVTIVQQEKPFEISSFTFERKKDQAVMGTENAESLAIDLKEMAVANDTILIDDQEVIVSKDDNAVYLKKTEGLWDIVEATYSKEKSPQRNGGFKDAFRHKMVFVYASKGSKEENEWYYNRTLFDAEKFWYRANGNVEIVKDTEFRTSNYVDQNVILYGNKDNNAAWDVLLKNSPIQVSNNQMIIGDKTLTGDQWGSYFIYPRPDSNIASIGVVTATGKKGMKGAYANDYLVNGTTFPDVFVFDHTMMKNGISGVKCSGFFGNNWSVEAGDFIWRD
ncbi:alpha/beta hydrolase-fold protein [Reichenbachiella sp. MALMAid0571]|uniref:carboxylesterase family protein n=1 Tax=Reichenbachiella sp. MALMAid0571 TaxID=3143939 RepID=UPI0032DEADDA